MIVKPTRYVRGPLWTSRRACYAHLTYLQYRPGPRGGAAGDRAPRALFDATKEDLTRHQVLAAIMAHGTARARFFRFVLSPGPDERIADWTDWTRQTMADLARHKQLHLQWAACRHDDERHPHVHVVLGGSGLDHSGVAHQVTMYTPDFVGLTGAAARYTERERDERLQRIADREARGAEARGRLLDRAHDERGEPAARAARGEIGRQGRAAAPRAPRASRGAAGEGPPGAGGREERAREARGDAPHPPIPRAAGRQADGRGSLPREPGGREERAGSEEREKER